MMVAAGGRRKAAGVPAAMIIVTDGKPNGEVSTLAKTAADAAKADGVKIFSIGVGGTYNLQNLKDMASTPHSNHVYELSTFDVSQFKEQLLTTICTEATGGNNNNGGASSGTRYVNKYAVNYNCDDGIVFPAGDSRGTTPNPANQADQKTRYVRVEDTTNPVVTLVGHQGEVVNSAGYQKNANDHGFEGMNGQSNTHDSLPNCNGRDCSGKSWNSGFFDYAQLSVGSTQIAWMVDSGTSTAVAAGLGGDDKTQWKGATCSDSCDTDPTLVATLHYGFGCDGGLVSDRQGNNAGQLANFPEYTAGQYSIKYTCTDGNEGDVRPGLTHSRCRNIRNVDHTKPVIQILGDDNMVLEATHTGNYVDDGAVCYDQVDGVISQNVEVSGDVVNLSKVGTYQIVYHCKDSAGNSAFTETRTVVVKQTACPTCSVTGCGAFGGSSSDGVPAVCTNQPIDIAFVLDSSGSIGSSNYANMKNQVGEIIKGLDISANMIQVGAHAYSHESHNALAASGFNLNEHYGDANVESAIDALPFHGSTTWTGTAIQHTMSTMMVAAGGRRKAAGVPAAMIIVTDGKPNGEVSTLAKTAADAAKADGVKIFSIC